MPLGRHVRRHSEPISPRYWIFSARARFTRRALVLAGSVALCAALVPGGSAVAAPAARSGNPSLKAVLAEARALSEQIDKLSQQYDALQIQLRQAKAAAAVAREDAARDQLILSQDQNSLGAI